MYYVLGTCHVPSVCSIHIHVLMQPQPCSAHTLVSPLAPCFPEEEKERWKAQEKAHLLISHQRWYTQ